MAEALHASGSYRRVWFAHPSHSVLVLHPDFTGVDGDTVPQTLLDMLPADFLSYQLLTVARVYLMVVVTLEDVCKLTGSSFLMIFQ